MTFEEYWNKEWAEVPTEIADRTVAEEVWNTSQRVAWEAVFQVVSDKAHLADREFIRELESAREAAGAGLGNSSSSVPGLALSGFTEEEFGEIVRGYIKRQPV